MFLNKIIVFGRLVDKPTTKETSKGSITNARIAFSPDRKPSQDTSQFISVTAFGKTGEILAKYGDKGDGFVFEGSLKQDVWKDKNSGEERRNFSINVNNVVFPGKGGNGKKQGGSTPNEDDVPF